MLTGLYWLSLGFAMAGTCILAAGFVGRHNGLLATGLSYLATGMGMFGVWTATTVSGFMGAMLIMGAVAVVILPLQRRQLPLEPHGAPSPSKDLVS
jgi:hypothetical protein